MRPLFFFFIAFATPVVADPAGYGHMTGWGNGSGMSMIFGPILWLIVLGLVIAGVIWFVRQFEQQSATKQSRSALEELDMRLARGDIEPEEYSARKSLLEG